MNDIPITGHDRNTFGKTRHVYTITNRNTGDRLAHIEDYSRTAALETWLEWATLQGIHTAPRQEHLVLDGAL